MQGKPELCRGDTDRQGCTIGTGYAQGFEITGALKAEELYSLISWLRRPTERRHSGPTESCPSGDQ